MATTSYYLQQMMNSSGVSQKTLQQIIQDLGGDINPNKSEYTPAEKMQVTVPQLRTIAQYLQDLGVQPGDYTYKYEDILNLMNAASAAGQEAQQNQLADAQRAYNVSMAQQQQSAADTLRQLSAQAIQSGMTRGVQSANMLSTLLGTSQQAAEGAQQLAESRVQAAKDYAAELAGNGTNALNTSNAATQQLLGNIRQLYNDDIQRETAELEYNASLEETLANYLAQKYVADTNYTANQHATAGNSWSQLQAALASMSGQAAAAEAQDNYTAAYLAAQEAARAAAYSTPSVSYSAPASVVAGAATATAALDAATKKAVQNAAQHTSKTTTGSTGSGGSQAKAGTKNLLVAK